jgi:hypothetical protein
MVKKAAKKSLLDAYQFDGFKTSSVVKGKFGDQNARVLSLSRRSKKVSALSAVSATDVITIAKLSSSGIFRVATGAFT